MRLVERNLVTLYLSRPILSELRRTLEYPEIRERNRQLTDEVADAFVARVSFRGVLVRDVPRVSDLPRDPADEPYVDLAAMVGADYLVTRDQDLLSLATDHSIEAKQFRQRFPGLAVVTPVDFLNAMERRTAT